MRSHERQKFIWFTSALKPTAHTFWYMIECVYSWSHTQAQMGNGVQLGFSIDITLRKDA